MEDICRVPFQVKSDEDSVLLLTFSSPLTSSLTSDETSLQTNSSSSVSYSLRPTDSTSAYLIYVELRPTPVSSVSLSLAVRTNLTDHYDVPVSQGQQQVTLSFSSNDSSGSDVATASQTTLVAFIGATMLFSLMVGKPQTSLGLINMLQFISLIPLMDFSISEELSSLLIGDNPFSNIPNLSTLVLKSSWFPKPYSKAEDYGFDNAGFLYNIGQEISVLAFLLLSLLGLFLGSRWECCCSLKRYCTKKLRAVKNSAVPGYLQGSFQELLVAAMVQLRSQSYVTGLSIVSCVFAWTFVVCACLGFILFGFASIRRPFVHSLFEFVNKFFSSSSPLERLQVPAFYAHRIVCVLVITTTSDSLVQGVLCLVVSFLVTSIQKLLLVIAVMFRLKKFDCSSLAIESSDSVSMGVLLLYASFPSIESSLGMINVFYGIIFSTTALCLATSIRRFVVICRKSRSRQVEV
jgi:hypothetical protein